MAAKVQSADSFEQVISSRSKESISELFVPRDTLHQPCDVVLIHGQRWQRIQSSLTSSLKGQTFSWVLLAALGIFYIFECFEKRKGEDGKVTCPAAFLPSVISSFFTQNKGWGRELGFLGPSPRSATDHLPTKEGLEFSFLL